MKFYGNENIPQKAIKINHKSKLNCHEEKSSYYNFLAFKMMHKNEIPIKMRNCANFSGQHESHAHFSDCMSTSLKTKCLVSNLLLQIL